MNSIKSPLLCLAIFVGFSIQQERLRAQTPEPSDTVIRSNVHEVLLDVVVRQKNLQLARKLTAADFKVTEDGIPQTIKTFRFVSGEDSDPPPEIVSSAPVSGQAKPEALPTASRKLEEPGFVSLVFDQLSPNSRKYAQDAAHSFLARELRSNLYVSIFRLGYYTNVIQNFSNNRELLTSAVDRAVLNQSSGLAQDDSNVLDQTSYTTSAGPGGIQVSSNVTLANTPDLATAGAETTIGEGATLRAQLDGEQRGNSMYQAGMLAVNALMNLVRYEATLPGRKTVVYLSEGLNLPPGRPELLAKVVDAAKRGGVTFYGIDVRGLGRVDANALGRNLLTEAANASPTASSAPVGRGHPPQPVPATKESFNQPETLNQMAAANTDLNMDSLATATGGFAVFDTNEIDKAMFRVMQDVRTHYEISYAPASENYDGHFRKIQVTVSNPKLTVQSREGYYSLPDLPGKSVLPFEMPALQALDTKPAPQAFPFRIEALRYRPEQPGFQYEIAFEVPTANITPHVDAARHKARLHATFLALIKDAHGQVVEKVSHEFDDQIEDDKLALFREGQMVFTSPVTLPPGHYTVEAATTDTEGNRASSRRVALVVGAPGAFTVSDISLVRDLQPLVALRDPENPLEFQGGRVTPDLTETAKAADGARLFFVLYPDHVDAKPKVTVQFFHDGAQVATTEPALSGPDEANSIPVIASAKLPVGDYEAKVTMEQSGRALRRSFTFTIAP